MKGFLRTWQKFNLADVEKHLIVVGELSSECYSCHHIGIAATTPKCPECNIEFKYMGFRRKVTPNYLQGLREQLPTLIFIDFDDFKKALGKKEARKLLDL